MLSEDKRDRLFGVIQAQAGAQEGVLGHEADVLPATLISGAAGGGGAVVGGGGGGGAARLAEQSGVSECIDIEQSSSPTSTLPLPLPCCAAALQARCWRATA